MSAEDDREVERILERRLATAAQVEEARTILAQMEAMGLRTRGVAEVLVEKGHLDAEDLVALHREERTFQGKDRIAGYELLERLGHGALGVVFKARQVSLDRIVALRVLDPELAKDPATVERFQTEARSVARLSHTNLISGIDVGVDDGLPYVVMEYADGITVARLLHRGGSMDEERALWIGLQAARALEHAHRGGLVHGDVKPEAIIVTNDGVTKLSDLGVGRAAMATGEGRGPQGEPWYLSPEQARGRGDVGPPADIYGLGATLFHMFAGRVPFPGESREAILARHLTEPVPSVRALEPDVSARTDEIVQRCLAKRPEDRYADASALVSALEEALREVRRARGAKQAAPAPSGRAAGPARAPGAPPSPTPAARPGARPGTGPPTPRRRRNR